MGLHSFGSAALSVLAGIPGGAPVGNTAIAQRSAYAVLKGSVEAGTIEGRFFKPLTPRETDQMMQAARSAADEGRRLLRAQRTGNRILSAIERLISRLTDSAVRVYQELTMLARVNHGCVYPSYDYLAAKTGYGRSTIRRSLSILEAIGFLVRQRRFKRITAEGPGPRYQQTSNAYQLRLPKSASRYLPRHKRATPLPADHEWRRGMEANETSRQVKSLPLDEFARMTGDDTALTSVLASLGAAIERQASCNRLDPHRSSGPNSVEIA